MKVFVSYSTLDGPAVRSLVDDLEKARQQVWMDEELGGGEAWWASILEHIRVCEVFVFALSDNSLNSKPCRAEVDYAKALGVPILPVKIGDVVSYRTDPIFSMQFVDYRDSSKSSGIALISAMHERAAQRTNLPDPLPDPPAIPYEYLQRLGATVRGESDLKSSVQLAILSELREALEDENDESVRRDIREILRALRSRKDVTYSVARDIDALVETEPAGTADPIDIKTPAAAKSQRVQRREPSEDGDQPKVPRKWVWISAAVAGVVAIAVGVAIAIMKGGGPDDKYTTDITYLPEGHCFGEERPGDLTDVGCDSPAAGFRSVDGSRPSTTKTDCGDAMVVAIPPSESDNYYRYWCVEKM